MMEKKKENKTIHANSQKAKLGNQELTNTKKKGDIELLQEILQSELSGLLMKVSDDNSCGENDSNDSLLNELNRAFRKVKPNDAQEFNKLNPQFEANLKKTHDIRLYVMFTTLLIYSEENPLKGLAKGLFLIRNCLECYWDCCYPIKNTASEDGKFHDRERALLECSTYINILYPLSKRPALTINRISFTVDEIINPSLVKSDDNKNLLVNLPRKKEKEYDYLIEWANFSLSLISDIEAIFSSKSTEIRLDDDIFNKEDKSLKSRLLDISKIKKKSGKKTKNSRANTTLLRDVKSIEDEINYINDRDDVIRVINLICEYYDINEPSSPVPLILERAKNVVKMDYRGICNELCIGNEADLSKVFGKSKK